MRVIIWAGSTHSKHTAGFNLLRLHQIQTGKLEKKNSGLRVWTAREKLLDKALNGALRLKRFNGAKERPHFYWQGIGCSQGWRGRYVKQWLNILFIENSESGPLDNPFVLQISWWLWANEYRRGHSSLEANCAREGVVFHDTCDTQWRTEWNETGKLKCKINCPCDASW